jgi:hypothetical protein
MNRRNISISIFLSTFIFISGCTNDIDTVEDNLTISSQQSIRTYSNDENQAPIAISKEYKIFPNTDLLMNVTATDEDNDTLTYELTQIPKHGSVDFNTTTGIFLYSPDQDFIKGEECFKFKAIDDHNNSSNCASIKIEIVDDNIKIPNRPSYLKAENIKSSTVELSWQDNSDNEKKFVIFQNSKKIGTTKSDENSFKVENLRAGESYEFSVKASNSAGYSGYDKITVVTPNDISLPKAPTILKLIKKSSSLIKLKWTDNANNEDGYRIYDNSGNFIKEITSRCTQYTIKNLQPNTTYTFIIKAFNDAGESNSSNTLRVKTCPKH